MNLPSKTAHPRAPLPEPLRGSDRDETFPYHTLSTRLPGIARQVLDNRDWHAEARRGLLALADEMPLGRLRPLQDRNAPDAAAWERHLSPYLGQTWLDAPWFVAETYFFRRVLEATGFYQEGPGQGVDPYRAHKLPEMADVPGALAGWCAALGALCADPPATPEQKTTTLARLLRSNIWGNQADRSLWPRGGSDIPGRPPADRQAEYLLVDDAPAASAALAGKPEPRRVDLVLDNGGVELAYDLALADYLLSSGLAGSVRLHAKPHPTYVSDATVTDVFEMVDFLVRVVDPQVADSPVASLAQRLSEHLAAQRLLLAADYFWTSPLSGWQMPPALFVELGQAALIISKGDANYRRWLGDRHWAHTTPIKDILSYLPAPWLALRVLKSNIMVGMQPGQAEALANKDARWLFSGRWGCIQFVN